MDVGAGPATDERVAGARGFWPLRDLPVVGWLLAVLVVSLVHPAVPAPRWLLIHLLVLGAAGHSILVWSRYFADTLTRRPPTPRAEQSRRLVLFDLGALAVVVGVPSGLRWLVVAGAAAIVVAVGWHVASMLRRPAALSSRFAWTLGWYAAAGVLLLVGVVLGTWLAHEPGEPLATRLRTAHIALNVLGWIGLSVLGTAVTLGPTMLRTRIAAGAEARARRALPLLVGGIVLVLVAALADRALLVPIGLGCYLLGAALVGSGLLRAARQAPPGTFPARSLLAGLLWLVGLLVTAVGWSAAIVVDRRGVDAWIGLGEVLDVLAPGFAAGFVAQVLLGALSYLVPVVMGGGPQAVRAMNLDLDLAGTHRVVVANTGLVVCLLPVPSLVRVLTSVLVLAALGSFVPILLRAIRRRHGRTATTAEPGAAERRSATGGTAAVGLAVVGLVVALGVAVDPGGGAARSASAGVAPTGETVEVDVVAEDMRFVPDTIEVRAGDRLVITLRNDDDGDVHDLVLDSGEDTGRLAPGEEATVDVGVVGRDLEGWCSVLGHRRMGMVLQVVVNGGEAADTGQDPAPGTGHHGAGHGGDQAPGPADPSAILDPVLPPSGPGRVHRRTLTITEHEQEVAPGVTRPVWTYDGRAPGPTLHGRVGDVFVITLVNEGTIGHSIDFHAGTRAPDRVMRTIPPGGSLTYRFTADRAGIWMYHCSSMPMSGHIASGLFGAVVIDPPGLPPVDRTFVLVQSERYDGADPDVPVDMARLAAEQPSDVVFNGYRDGYVHRPLRARVGERLRIWVLDAGPNRPLSFHVVGGRFDTVYAEGAWRLGSARGPAADGGAQVLPLLPAQGGFVELELTEPGTYPFVNHVMVDAERGAHGILRVRRRR